MADIFVSYSHQDTDFVHKLVPALEAEGLSVWWDHTIPPGKTWDGVIARGINDAKASIVVWSVNSVVSDWVKEEAELAKGAGKYLPVQIGTDLPPMGFRRIQAADLRNWNGNAQDPQWRMLMVEAANLVRGNLAPPPPAPAPTPPPALDLAPSPVSVGAKKNHRVCGRGVSPDRRWFMESRRLVCTVASQHARGRHGRKQLRRRLLERLGGSHPIGTQNSVVRDLSG